MCSEEIVDVILEAVAQQAGIQLRFMPRSGKEQLRGAIKEIIAALGSRGYKIVKE